MPDACPVFEQLLGSRIVGVREAVVSAGAGLRFHLFDLAVAQLDLVCPFGRPGKGWIWHFELQPGF